MNRILKNATFPCVINGWNKRDSDSRSSSSKGYPENCPRRKLPPVRVRVWVRVRVNFWVVEQFSSGSIVLEPPEGVFCNDLLNFIGPITIKRYHFAGCFDSLSS